jgi:hypothetical protein
MSESLRDQLTANLDAIEPAETAPVEQAPSEPAAQVTPEPVEAKPGRTAGRERDASGRLMPGAAKKEEAPQEPVTAPIEAAPVKQRPPRPSTWKKDYWGHWDQIDPSLAEYLVQREGEFAKGVSTYKQEWESAKPLIEAMAPFQQVLQQHNIQPAQWISNLGNAHQKLAMGSPQEKLGMFVKLAQDYQVPLDGLFTQGQDGKVYLNANLQAPQQPQMSQSEIDRILESKLTQWEIARELQAFQSNKEKYPHYEVVRETMAGLLQAGLATDLASAYEAALRHPRHSDIFDTEQRLARETEEKRVAEEKRKQAEAARRNTVSVRGATPTASPSGSGAKGLRNQLSEAFDAVTVGRV